MGGESRLKRERKKDALDNNLVTIAWNELENLSKITNRGELEDIYIKAYENERNKRNFKLSVNQNVGQILDFLKEIKNDDIVILPLLSKDTEFL